MEAQFDTYIDDPNFLKNALSFTAKNRKEKRKLDPDNITRLAEEEWDELSNAADKTDLQESVSIRNVLRTRRIANILIDEKGLINLDVLKKFIQVFSRHCYFLGRGRESDHKRNEHILACLKQIEESKELKAAIQHISKPNMHRWAEEVIRRTLNLPLNTQITDAHARRAAVSAWLTYLRQAVGSCFATAPAIIVHDEQPLQFFKDINELFATGKLKRTFGGIEYTAPLCVSSGKGGLNKPLYVQAEMAGDLAESPNLIEAFESVSIEKETLFTLLAESLREAEYTTPESLIRKMLLLHFKITEKDVKNFEERPHGMVHGGLLMQTAKRKKGEAVPDFLAAFETAKWGFKSLGENALLRVWEYTVASFAETKAEFSKWNLYASLGLASNEEGGIGEALFSYLQTKLVALNRDVENFQIEYEQLYASIKALESRMRHIGSEEEAKWLRVEYQAKSHELNTVLELRDKAHARAKRTAASFQLLIDSYIELFPKYFQEVYDPEIGGIVGSIYDDTPAGFRLLFKHGRASSSLWTYIHNHNEFIECLVAFFVAAERELAHEPDFTGAEQDLSEITSIIVSHVRSERFIETAFFRMARAHGVSCPEKPLEHLELVEKKPWIYTSGGNFITLCSVYFSRSEKPTTVKRWVENPMELLVFIADTIKKVPYKAVQEANSLLMFSPTHAFLLKPHMFQKAWDSPEFTFTWIRDEFVRPQERFVDNILLNQDMMAFLAKRISENLSQHHKHLFLKRFGDIRGSMSVRDFRSHIEMGVDRDPGFMAGGVNVIRPGLIDRVLFEELPLFPNYKLREVVERVLSRMNFAEKEEALKLLDSLTTSVGRESVMGAKKLMEVLLGLILLVTKKTSFEENLQLSLREIMENEGYAIKAPIVFADSNWTRDMFAFVVAPGTSRLEFWRTGDLGMTGEPMTHWRHWLDGSRKDPEWGILVNPVEYKAASLDRKLLL